MLLLDDKAHVYAVGSNSWGRLGRGHRADERDNRIPRPVAGIGNASAVKCKLIRFLVLEGVLLVSACSRRVSRCFLHCEQRAATQLMNLDVEVILARHALKELQ